MTGAAIPDTARTARKHYSRRGPNDRNAELEGLNRDLRSRASTMHKPEARLDHWRIIRVSEGTRHLVGIAHGHYPIREGGRIVNSAILTIADNSAWAETEDTLYRLGGRGEGRLANEPRKSTHSCSMSRITRRSSTGQPRI